MTIKITKHISGIRLETYRECSNIARKIIKHN
jgi:hypothetical protein